MYHAQRKEMNYTDIFNIRRQVVENAVVVLIVIETLGKKMSHFWANRDTITTSIGRLTAYAYIRTVGKVALMVI